VRCGWLALAGLVSSLGGDVLAGAPVAPPLRVAAGEVDEGDVMSMSSLLTAAAVDLAGGDGEAALARLARVAAVEPDNPWMLYYRGAALVLLRRPYDALAALDAAAERLAALGDPDGALRVQIAELRARARRQVFAFDLRFGLAYTTNATFTGSGGQELGFISGRSDKLFGLEVQASFAPIANDRDVLAIAVRSAQSWHFRVKEFDFQDYGALLRYAHRWDEAWESSIAYTYEFAVLERQSYLCSHAVTLGLDYHWPRNEGQVQPKRTGVYYRLEGDDFLFSTPDALGRDGLVHVFGVEQALQVQPLAGSPWTWDVRGGYAFESAHTEGTEFDRHTNAFHVHCGFPLVNPRDPDAYLLWADRELRIDFDAAWALDRYRRPSLYDSRRRHRRDWVTNLTLDIAQVLEHDPQRGDITLHAIVGWTDSDSNVRTRRGGVPFSYDQLYYGLQIAWSW